MAGYRKRDGTFLPLSVDGLNYYVPPSYNGTDQGDLYLWMQVMSSGGATGGGISGVVDVATYGASPTASATANSAGIQAALDALTSINGGNGGQILQFAAGVYSVDKPPLFHTQFCGVRGVGDMATIIKANRSFVGPTWVTGPTQAAGYGPPPLITALLTGTGSAFRQSSTPSPCYFYNLNDCLSGRIGGMTAFTIGFTMKIAASAVGVGGAIIQSLGTHISGGNGTQAFQLYVTPSAGQFVLHTKIKTVNGEIGADSATALDAGIQYHVELGYDGTNMYLFVDGVLKDTKAQTGAIKQEIWETICLGRSPGAFPQGSGTNSVLDCDLDSIRISSVCRHTAGFTKPTAKYTYDSSTRMLFNFDRFDRGFMVATGNPPGVGQQLDHYFWLRGIAASSIGEKLSMENMGFYGDAYGGGLIITGAYQSRFENINIRAANFGLFIESANSFENYFKQIQVNGAGASAVDGCLYGIAVNGSSILQFDQCFQRGVAVGYAFYGGLGTLNTCSIEATAATHYAGWFDNSGVDGWTLNTFIIDAETAAGSFRGGLLVQNSNFFVMNGGFIDIAGTGVVAAPAIKFVKTAGVELSGVFSNVNPACPQHYFVDTGNPLLGPIEMHGCIRGVGSVAVPFLLDDKNGLMSDQAASGLATVLAGTTSISVVFTFPMIDASYVVACSAGPVSGVPAAGANRVKSISGQTKNGFTINVETDPGGITTQGIFWRVERRNL